MFEWPYSKTSGSAIRLINKIPFLFANGFFSDIFKKLCKKKVILIISSLKIIYSLLITVSVTPDNESKHIIVCP